MGSIIINVTFNIRYKRVQNCSNLQDKSEKMLVDVKYKWNP